MIETTNKKHLRFPEFENNSVYDWRNDMVLNDVAYLVKGKFLYTDLTIHNYISTDNMLPDFGGVSVASKIPTKGTLNGFENGDILFSNIRTYLKKVWHAEFKGACNSDVLVFRTKDKEVLSNNFLYIILTHYNFTAYSNATSKGTKMPRGNKQAMLNYNMSIPHKDEQQKIAGFLSVVDKRIELLQAKYDHLQKYKTGILQKIFTQQIRFKKSDGTNYPDWESIPLEKLGKFSGAGVDKKTNENEPLVNLLNFMDIVRNKFLYSDVTNHIVSAPEKKLDGCSVLKGDLILTPSSETREELAFSGVVMENMENTVYSYHVLRFRFTKDVDLKFKAYMLENDYFRKQAYEMGEGSGQRYVISMKLFNKMEVFMPTDTNEQRAIGNFLSALDEKITNTQTQITKTKSFKQGLLQQMFV